jgi:hypothetical protein
VWLFLTCGQPKDLIGSSVSVQSRVSVADWYYIGHYGQLGPLEFEQVEELIQGGVISRDTYVWHHGLADWLAAERVPELLNAFKLVDPVLAPPPPPMSRPMVPAAPNQRAVGAGLLYLSASSDLSQTYGIVRSDRSRAIAGLLQAFPGVGRMYLGYWAHGVLQLVFAMCGVGILWSWIDGLFILAGWVKLDGYGRRLPE